MGKHRRSHRTATAEAILQVTARAMCQEAKTQRSRRINYLQLPRGQTTNTTAIHSLLSKSSRARIEAQV